MLKFDNRRINFLPSYYWYNDNSCILKINQRINTKYPNKIEYLKSSDTKGINGEMIIQFTLMDKNFQSIILNTSSIVKNKIMFKAAHYDTWWGDLEVANRSRNGIRNVIQEKIDRYNQILKNKKDPGITSKLQLLKSYPF